MATSLKNSLISVLMPAYNSEKFIYSSIESVFKCHYKNLELIIIDDGSVDSTKEIIQQFDRERYNIKYYFKNNSGIPDTLNLGIQKCTGKWIARIDSDDLCINNRFEEQIRYAIKNPRLGLVGSNAIFINESGKFIYQYSYPVNNQKLITNLLNSKAFFPHSSAFFQKELAESVGGYRTRIEHAEDLDLWIRMSEKAEIGCINKTLVKIRTHKDQITIGNIQNQAFSSRIATVSYWFKVNKKTDPVDSLNFDEFKLFKSDLIKIFKKTYLDKYIDFTSCIKKPIFKRIILPFYFLKFFSRPNIIYYFFIHKFFSKYHNFKIAKNYASKFK